MRSTVISSEQRTQDRTEIECSKPHKIQHAEGWKGGGGKVKYNTRRRGSCLFSFPIISGSGGSAAAAVGMPNNWRLPPDQQIKERKF